jgi:hypothetical protein
MSSSLRSILGVLAVLAAAANVQAAGKGHPPAHQAHKAPNHVAHAKTAAKGHPPAAHQAHKAPNHVSHTKVNHHRRPAVHRRPVQRVQRVQRSATRIVRQSVRPNVLRTVQRYPIRRVQRNFVRRPYYSGLYPGIRRYTYSYYPRRYVWRTSYYNRGSGASRRRASRGIGGIVESVQGNANNGMLLVKVLRPRSSRFRYATTNAAARRGATSLHRFHLNNGTRYEVLTTPRRGGTIADLHKGEHVMIQKHTNAANTAQTVQVSPLRKR